MSISANAPIIISGVDAVSPLRITTKPLMDSKESENLNNQSFNNFIKYPRSTHFYSLIVNLVNSHECHGFPWHCFVLIFHNLIICYEKEKIYVRIPKSKNYLTLLVQFVEEAEKIHK